MCSALTELGFASYIPEEPSCTNFVGRFSSCSKKFVVGGLQRTLSMSRVSAIQTANAARTGALTTSAGRIVSGSINSKCSSFISGACYKTAAARHLMAAASRSPQAMDCLGRAL
jgi:hypothetical protein